VQIAFTTSAQTVAAGDCSGVVTVESQDTHGNDSEVGSNTNITLAGDSGTMSFFSDSGCSTGIGTTATITSGTDEVSFYYKDTSEGTTNLSLSSSLTDPSDQAQTIQANTAVTLVLLTSGHTVAAGDCSAVVTLEARDTHGNDSEVGSNTNITLAGDSGTMTFFSDSGCSSSIGTTATMTSGTDQVSFYYKDTSEGTTSLSFSSSLTDPSAQNQTIQANTATQLAFTTSAQTLAAGDCSGVVTVEARDTHGNDSEVGSNTNITLAGDSGTMSFFSDSGCSTGIGTTATITSGTDEVSFYYKDTSEGTTNLSLSSSLTDPSDQAQTIQANTAVQLAFTTSAQTIAAGDCSAVVTVEARDTHGNDSEVGSNTNITLAGDSGTMSFFSDSGCSTGIGTTATITSGTDEVSFYYKDTSEGTTDLSLSSSLTDPSDQAQTIQANTAVTLVLLTSGHTVAAGDCSAVVTLEARDTHGNDSEVGSNTNITLAGDSGTMSFFSDSGCSSSIGTTATMTSGTDQVSFYYKDTSEGTTSLSFSSSLTDPSAQNQTIQANTAAQLAFTTSAQTVTAGDCSGVVTVESQDTHGNDSEVGSNTNITLAGDSGTMSFFSDSGCSTGIGTTATITSGTDEVSFYYKDTSEGTTNLSLTSSLTDPSDQAQTIQANTAVTLVLLTSAQTLTAGDCSAVVTLEARDTHGNDADVGSNTNITLAGDSGTMSFFSDSGCSTGIGTTATITSGTDEVSFYFKDTTDGTTNLSFSSALTDPSDQAQTINHGAVAALNWDTEIVANEITNTNFTTAGVISAEDAHGNPIVDTNETIVVSYSSNSDCSSDSTANLSNNSGTTSSGSLTLSTVQSSASGGPYYFKAYVSGSPGISACTSGTSSIYDPISISPASPTVSALGTQTFVITGGVPAITCNDIVTNNSGGSVTSSCYTAACAGDYCIDYTAGVQGSNTDTVRTTDFKGNSADATITVNGGQFNASSASYSFPGGTCTGGGTSTTITVANDGNVHATSVSESLSGDAELTYNASSTCGISDTDLNTGGADTCDIIIDFDGSSGSHSATVTIQDTTNGGSTTVSFDATCP
ncbi:MAG: beta strand repeat-containing protein, partial [Bacteriovoracaceae bacterium]